MSLFFCAHDTPTRSIPRMEPERGRPPLRRTGPGLYLLALCLIPGPATAQGQANTPTEFRLPRFELGPTADLALAGPVRPGVYAGAVGTEAAWLGAEDGVGEIWAHPLKVVRSLGLSFSIPQYDDPIPGTRVASGVQVAPGHVRVDYAHEGFVVRHHILAPRNQPGILMLLEVDAVVDLEIRVEFQPVLQLAWPGGFGGQYLFWDAGARAFVLSESRQERNGVIGSPWATEASAHPAHRLAEAPSVFIIPVDRERAGRELIPIAVAAGVAPREEIMAVYRQLLEDAPALVEETAAWGRSLASDHFSFQATGPQAPPQAPGGWDLRPDVVDWAKINLAEQEVCNPSLGCGLVAGWGPSGTSYRAGFGWYFGGDAAINTLAMDATGQWDLVAEALRFLAGYQREDGKIPHEISQAAAHIPWFEEFPYAYYHADTTPYWMLALWHYWKASGDDQLLRELWPAFQRAYAWCLSVETDGDGIIENTTGGLGAIEVGGLGEGIHQDIYLAAVWTEALQGTEDMARYLGDHETADQAERLLVQARSTLNRGYWMEDKGYHAFGILRGGGTNGNLTAWPATALGFGLLEEDRAEGSLFNLARETISASWGARLLSTESELYDPLHYNNGMVWPFMTGFVAWGQYRYRRPWAGYPLLQALWRLHGDWSLGRHPENMSGAYYQTLDATVPHQFFASSMLVTPLARGLLGWNPDAPRGRAALAPQPHPGWDTFQARNLEVGDTRVDLVYRREGERAETEIRGRGSPLDLTYVQAIPLGARNVTMEGTTTGGRTLTGRHDLRHEVTVRLSGEEPATLHFRWDGGLEVFPADGMALARGSRSGGVRILDFVLREGAWILTLEGDPGQAGRVVLRGEAVEPHTGRITPGPEEGFQTLEVTFPEGDQRTLLTVVLTPAGA